MLRQGKVLYDVKYVMGGSDKRVEAEYVEFLRNSSKQASRASGTSGKLCGVEVEVVEAGGAVVPSVAESAAVQSSPRFPSREWP